MGSTVRLKVPGHLTKGRGSQIIHTPLLVLLKAIPGDLGPHACHVCSSGASLLVRTQEGHL